MGFAHKSILYANWHKNNRAKKRDLIVDSGVVKPSNVDDSTLVTEI